MVLNHLYHSLVYSAKGTSLAMLQTIRLKVSTRRAMVGGIKRNLISSRMHARSSLAVVDAAFALVDPFSSCSNLFDLLVSFEPAILEESTAAYHGPFLLLRLCGKPRRKFSFARKDRHCFCCRCFRHWLSRKCLLSCGPRDSVYLNGYRCLVSCTCERPCLSCLSEASNLSISFKSGIAQGGGLTQTYHSSAEQYSSGFSLALRMISVAAGVTIGLFVSQVIGVFVLLALSNGHTTCPHLIQVYLFGNRKNAAHFAFWCLAYLSFLFSVARTALCDLFLPKNTYECNIVVFPHSH